jgi:hypothetical protein
MMLTLTKVALAVVLKAGNISCEFKNLWSALDNAASFYVSCGSTWNKADCHFRQSRRPLASKMTSIVN